MDKLWIILELGFALTLGKQGKVVRFYPAKEREKNRPMRKKVPLMEAVALGLYLLIRVGATHASPLRRSRLTLEPRALREPPLRNEAYSG